MRDLDKINYGGYGIDENSNYDHENTRKNPINYTIPVKHSKQIDPKIEEDIKISLKNFTGNSEVRGEPNFIPKESTIYGPWTIDGSTYFISFYKDCKWHHNQLDVNAENPTVNQITFNNLQENPTNTTNSIYSVNSELFFNGKTVDKNFTFNQDVPSALWTINHNLNKNPSVSVVDSAGTTVEGGYVIYVDKNNLQIEFGAPFSGSAELN